MITQEQLHDVLVDVRNLWFAVQTDNPDQIEACLGSIDRPDAVAVVLAALLPARSLPAVTPRRGRCGSEEGYLDHIGLDEVPCPDCRRAHTRRRQIDRQRAAARRAG